MDTCMYRHASAVPFSPMNVMANYSFPLSLKILPNSVLQVASCHPRFIKWDGCVDSFIVSGPSLFSDPVSPLLMIWKLLQQPCCDRYCSVSVT